MSIFRAVPYILMSGGLGDSQCKDRDTIKVQRVLLMARSLAQKTETIPPDFFALSFFPDNAFLRSDRIPAPPALLLIGLPLT
jgi:hypothetical protein